VTGTPGMRKMEGLCRIISETPGGKKACRQHRKEKTMRLYPVSLNVHGRLCVVIGSGEVARRKIESLLAAGARVKACSPDPPGLEGIEWIGRTYARGDLEGAFLAIAATDNREVNREVSREAQERGIPVNVVDDPELSTFHVPSLVSRGDLQISVSTGGRCPSLARAMRRELENLYGPEYEEYLDALERARQQIIATFPPGKRGELMAGLIEQADIVGFIKTGKPERARELIEQIISLQKARFEKQEGASQGDTPC